LVAWFVPRNGEESSIEQLQEQIRVKRIAQAGRQ
jgi:hypothetical protein